MDFLTSNFNNLDVTYNGRKVYSQYVEQFIKSINVFNDIDDNFIDTWNDRRLYGRVNAWNKPIFPKQEKIISKEDGESAYYGMDFVLDMFFEFKRYYEAVAQKNKWAFKIDSTSLETYVHPVDQYTSYLAIILKEFNNVLKAAIVDPYYLSFDTYLKELCAVIDRQREKRVLFSSYILSSDYDVTGSGLYIDLVSADYFSDMKKVEDFFQKAHYKFLVESARRFGFLVDKNIPWRIVVDLNSFATSYFIKRRREFNILTNNEIEQVELEQFMEMFSTENEQYMFKNGKELLIDIFADYFGVAYWEGSGEVSLFVEAARESFINFKGNKNLGCINTYDHFMLMNFYMRVFQREIGLFNIFTKM